MCKFENDNAPGFDLVAEGIQRYADDAPETILGRWEAEMGEHRVRGIAEVADVPNFILMVGGYCHICLAKLTDIPTR